MWQTQEITTLGNKEIGQRPNWVLWVFISKMLYLLAKNSFIFYLHINVKISSNHPLDVWTLWSTYAQTWDRERYITQTQKKLDLSHQIWAV